MTITEKEITKITYDLSLIYAQEKLRVALEGHSREESVETRLNEVHYLKKEFAFALDMLSNMDADYFLKDFVYAFGGKE